MSLSANIIIDAVTVCKYHILNRDQSLWISSSIDIIGFWNLSTLGARGGYVIKEPHLERMTSASHTQ